MHLHFLSQGATNVTKNLFNAPNREFIYTKQPYISACHLEGIEENVILIDSVSKRYSECGIRIGALIIKNKEVRLAYVLNKEDLSKAIFVLQKALEEYNRQNGQA